MSKRAVWAMWAALLGVLAWLTWKSYKAGVGAGKASVKAAKGVKYVDPCPGVNTIWDTPSGKCIPLIEEPVGLTGKSRRN